ncbi:hypothetical protein [Reichenbachiella versicolor]|uniref:hypothetical protein n=1 Tax=Reichenbachiella versicolor TaxID=1821036 RepID=UPI000D6E9BA7|nr:hypothetical protein [Reichenbachiella versicolor]
MSDNHLRSALTTLERKVILLIGNNQKLKQENDAYRAELAEVKAKLADREGQLEGFQNKDKISKIVNGMVTSESDPEQLGDMLDEYIKEVDKCIAQLSE